MKNSFFKKIDFNKVLFAFMTFLILLFLGFILYSNILPLKYFIVCTIIMLLWAVALFFLLAYKNKKNKKRKIVGYIISVFLIAIMGFIFYYLNNTLGFFKGFGDNKYKEENYLVLVLNNSNYQKIEDLNNLNIGYVPNELSTIGEAIDKLSNSIEISIENYEQYDKLIEDLSKETLAAIVVEETYYAILNEENKYDFRTLYTINIKTEISISKEVDVTKDAFAVYISGIDTFGKISTVSRSDVNIVAVVHPKTKQVLLVTVPRDYYVQLRGTTGLKDKLTHAGIYGVETSIGTLEDLLYTDINYYFRVNFSSVQKIVDALGGVDVYSKYDFYSAETTGGAYHFKQGYNHLNGKQALVFARERYQVPGGDRTRGINQQAVIDGVIRKATSPAIITKYNNLLKSLEGTFQTNMEDKDIQKLIKMQLNDMASWNVTSYSLDGTDAYDYTYSHQHETLYVMVPNEEIVSEAKNLIDKVVSGEKLDGSYGEVGNVTNPEEIITPEVPEQPEVPEELPEEPSDEPIEDPNETPDINPDEITDPNNPLSPVDPEKPEEDDTTEDGETDDEIDTELPEEPSDDSNLEEPTEEPDLDEDISDSDIIEP